MGILPQSLEKLRHTMAEKQDENTAWHIIDDYFSFFGLDDVYEELWMLTVGALTSDEIHQMEKGRDRYNTLFFFEYTKMFAAAVHLVYTEHKKNNEAGKMINHSQ